MLIIGLTGSIATGKTTVSSLLSRMGIPVCNSDEVVNFILDQDKTVIKQIGKKFFKKIPNLFVNGKINKIVLSHHAFKNPSLLRLLEQIIQPQVLAQQKKFFKRMCLNRRKVVILETPLLIEANSYKFCDFVLLVSAPAFLQKMRALSRSGMNEKKFFQILKNQMPTFQKKKLVDFTINTGLGRIHTVRLIRRVINHLLEKKGNKWPFCSELLLRGDHSPKVD